MRTAILILTNKNSTVIVEEYNKLKTELDNNLYDIFVLYNKTSDDIPITIQQTNYLCITNDIFDELKIEEFNYKHWSGRTLHGNEILALYKFYLENKKYDYYWFIEDDVRFSGNWSVFFKAFEEQKIDFISSDIKWLVRKDNWYFSESLYHQSKKIPYEKRLKSFNPIYRISNLALDYIGEQYKNGWKGFHEILFPTLLYNANFTIGDYGGDGEFVLSNIKNKFYSYYTDSSGNINNTCAWRPILSEIGDIPNMIYHPVKNF